MLACFEGLYQGFDVSHALAVREVVEHETDLVEGPFVAEHHVGIPRGGLHGEGGLVGSKSGQNASRSSGDERQTILRRDHQPIPDPNAGKAEDEQPIGDQLTAMMLHGVDANVNAGVTASLNAQHPLIQRDVHPFQ